MNWVRWSNQTKIERSTVLTPNSRLVCHANSSNVLFITLINYKSKVYIHIRQRSDTGIMQYAKWVEQEYFWRNIAFVLYRICYEKRERNVSNLMQLVFNLIQTWGPFEVWRSWWVFVNFPQNLTGAILMLVMLPL